MDLVHRRYTKNDFGNSRFFMLYKELFKGKYLKLNNNDRVIYSVLLDRFELSIQNGWVDEEGSIYFYFTQKTLSESCAVSERTVRNSIEQLKDAGLIESVRQGMNLPNRLYLLKPEYQEKQAEKSCEPSVYPERQNLPFQTGKNCRSGQAEFATPDRQNLPPNDTDINKTNKISSSMADEEDALIRIREKTCLEECELDERQAELGCQIRNVLTQVFLHPPEAFNVGGRMIPFNADMQKKVLEHLTPEIFKILITRMQENPKPIKNPKAFLMACLFNSMSFPAKPERQKTSKNSFNNFKQNDYDFVSLEQEILSN